MRQKLQFLTFFQKVTNKQGALQIFSILYEIGNPTDTTKVSTNRLIQTFFQNREIDFNFPEVDTSSYFKYYGSLTAPSCEEVVAWTIFDQAVEISELQAEKIRSLRVDKQKITGVNREPQRMNKRKVTRYTTIMETTTFPSRYSSGVRHDVSKNSGVIILIAMIFLT